MTGSAVTGGDKSDLEALDDLDDLVDAFATEQVRPRTLSKRSLASFRAMNRSRNQRGWRAQLTRYKGHKKRREQEQK